MPLPPPSSGGEVLAQLPLHTHPVMETSEVPGQLYALKSADQCGYDYISFSSYLVLLHIVEDFNFQPLY